MERKKILDSGEVVEYFHSFAIYTQDQRGKSKTCDLKIFNVVLSGPQSIPPILELWGKKWALSVFSYFAFC